jgi:hypothetical protein
MGKRISIGVVLALGLILPAVASYGGGSPRLQPLPEGGGIAAKSAGHQGIEQDPAVVFADGFETTDTGQLPDGYHKGGNTKWDNTWGGCLIIEQAENVHSGKKAVQMTIVRPGSGEAGGLAVERHFEAGFDTLFLRYYAKFEKNTELYHGGGAQRRGHRGKSPGRPPGMPGGAR